jgi:hypothetical protein
MEQISKSIFQEDGALLIERSEALEFFCIIHSSSRSEP